MVYSEVPEPIRPAVEQGSPAAETPLSDIMRMALGETSPEYPSWYLTGSKQAIPGLQCDVEQNKDSSVSHSSLLSPLYAALDRTLAFGSVSETAATTRRLGSEDVPVYVSSRRALASYAAAPPGTSEMEFMELLIATGLFRYSVACIKCLSLMRFFITEAGRMGIGPTSMQPGDRVVVLKGGRVPFLLRPQGNRPGWTESRRVYSFLGPVYVDGCMDGEAVEGVSDSGWRKVLDTHTVGYNSGSKKWKQIYLV
jgi:hypothetical protein